MPRNEILVDVKKKRNLEVVNINTMKKELEKMAEKAEELKKNITKSEATVEEYDTIISAIEKAGGV